MYFLGQKSKAWRHLQTGLHKGEIPGGAEMPKWEWAGLQKSVQRLPSLGHLTETAAPGIEDLSPVLKTDHSALLFPLPS